MEIVVIALIIWLACGVAGGMMMSSKGRSSCGGFFLGFVLGPIGLAFALIAPESTERRIEKERLARGRDWRDEGLQSDDAENERRLREQIRAEERRRVEEELRREREREDD